MQGNCSIVIKNVNKENSGIYKMKLWKRDRQIVVGSVEFHVYSAQQFSLVAVPPNAAVGTNVLLNVINMPDYEVCNWYENEKFNMLSMGSSGEDRPATPGVGYVDKVDMYRNCSIVIKNVNKNDSGIYKIKFRKRNFAPLIESVEFHVYYPVTKPSIQVNQTIGNDFVSVFLNCPTNDNDNSIQWFFKGQSMNNTNRMRLAQNNRTLEIIPARREDSGDYHCHISNPLGSMRSDPIQLDVIDPVTKPCIQVNQIIGNDLVSVFLNCPTNDNDNSIQWFVKGQSMNNMNRMRLAQNNRTLEIIPARKEDSGDYHCHVSNPLGSMKSDPIQLDIIGE
nr:carcinoembryonic antigen-related cell adhesion molecule 3-like [Peromyscus maniculatus bairdii]